MASYIIAGQATGSGAESYARAEWVAKQIEAACPNVHFQYEMKHPDAWKEFVNGVFRKMDFDGYTEDFQGPLVWTHEGQLIGGSAEFVQKVCIEKFGMKNPPSVTSDIFKQIASDNFKQVKQQLHRQRKGPSFRERCDVAQARAEEAGLVAGAVLGDRTTTVHGGVSLEVWSAAGLEEERAASRASAVEGRATVVDARLVVGPVGQEQSHSCVLHPRPMVRRQMAVVSRHCAVAKAEEPAPPACEEPAEASAEPVLVSDAPEAPTLLEVKANPFGRTDDGQDEKDLSRADVDAAMEVLCSLGGVAVWMGLGSRYEYREAIDTHLSVLPMPVFASGDGGSPLRFPMELACDRAIQDEARQLRVYSTFKHSFAPLTEEGASQTPHDLAKKAIAVYDAARGETKALGSACAVAFTAAWIIVVPLRLPELGSVEHEIWLKMPPPPPCALIGVVICPTVQKDWPEAAGLEASDAAVVSSRAELEGIPPDSAEFAEAEREVRITAAVTQRPAEVIGLWAFPVTAEE